MGQYYKHMRFSKKLQIMGHETEFINLRPESQKSMYKIIRESDVGIHKLFHYLIFPALKKRYNHFERFIK